MPGGYLIRLRVMSHSATAHDFCAQVTNAIGFGPRDPEPPWWVPWRHTKTRLTRLYPNVPELLTVGSLQADRLTCDVLSYEGEAPTPQPGTVPLGGLDMRVVVWEPRSGQIAKVAGLHIPHVSRHTPTNPGITLDVSDG
jgi:hypothetical protein